MSEYIKEDAFVIAEGSKGELYFFMNAKQYTPEKPLIIYDGKDHAVFLRNKEQKIILDYINPDIRGKLSTIAEVTIVETILENIKDTYNVKLNIVDEIPVDWNKVGLEEWNSNNTIN